MRSIKILLRFAVLAGACAALAAGGDEKIVIHVPAVTAVHVVKASAENEARVMSVDRVDPMFTLEPEKKK